GRFHTQRRSLLHRTRGRSHSRLRGLRHPRQPCYLLVALTHGRHAASKPTLSGRNPMPTPAKAPVARSRRLCGFLSLLLLGALPLSGAAQPSGGPYGPIPQTYAVPTGGNVHHVAPDGDASVQGASPDRPTTLEAAIARVVTGDTIVLRGGTYRTGG